jgi:pimeloyl-ACP methyl ester carboxylesterase
MTFNQPRFRHQCDEVYEKLAKPGNDYSIYSNKHYQGEILLGDFLVEQVFEDQDSGFYSLGLVSVSGNNPAVLVVRGFGNWGALEGFPKDFFPYQDIPDVFLALSDEHFQSAKKVGVIQWLQNKAILGMKAELVGQSLGGKIGQQLTIEAPDYIASLVTFNSIGISKEEVEKYQGNVEIYHYLNPADLVPYVLGEAFLPGIILQVYSPNIKNFDLLGQHNNLLLNQSVTILKQVDFETFNWVRSLQSSVNKYTGEIYQKVFDLNQISQEKSIECDTSQNNLGENIQQQIANYSKLVQQELSHLRLAIQQELIAGNDSKSSAIQLQDKVNFSVEAIQEQLEALKKIAPEKLNFSGQTFKDFSKTIKQEIQEAVSIIQEKLKENR